MTEAPDPSRAFLSNLKTATNGQLLALVYTVVEEWQWVAVKRELDRRGLKR